MLTILIAIADSQMSASLHRALQQHEGVIAVLPDDPGAHQASVAICWRPPATLLDDFPNLRLLQSAAAGIDHFSPAICSAGLPICRVVDARQQQGMLDYLLWAVLHHHRDFDRMLRNQQASIWHEFAQRHAADVPLGVLGLGAIGSHVASGLRARGYPVAGWCRSPKSLPGVDVYCTAAALSEFLATTEVLINLLPLNYDTVGILNADLFAQLPAGATLINVARGAHLVEQDLLDALASGQLRMAILDVFATEPLPPQHPFWSHPQIIATPHIASNAPVAAIAELAITNAQRLAQGEPLLYPVSELG